MTDAWQYRNNASSDKKFTIASVVWAIVGFLVGLYIALQMAFHG
jgi:cbb3-type cytochrome oxidase subunit 1